MKDLDEFRDAVITGDGLRVDHLLEGLIEFVVDASIDELKVFEEEAARFSFETYVHASQYENWNRGQLNGLLRVARFRIARALALVYKTPQEIVEAGNTHKV